MKKLSFYFIALLIPFVLLLSIEGVLRIIELREPQPLFIEATGQAGYLMPNEKVIQRFFPSANLAPNVSPDTQFFRQSKSPDSLRIVVQGGSTAAGFPFGRWGSLSGMLQQRFKRLYPNKDIEIINTAMASVNSYTLLDFVDEIIQIEPDLVLIYAGHNEYLGIMGVGSAYASRGGRSANLLYLALKDWQLYRMVESLYYGFAASVEQNTESDQLNDRTLMARIAKDKDIQLNSDIFHAGIAQFEGNLSLILDKYENAGIPVVIGDLVSNEKDLIPFSAINALAGEEMQEITLMGSSQNRELISNLRHVIDNDLSKNLAADYFKLGHGLLMSGQENKAKQAFIDAKDHDTLRFRAPSEFNRIIEALSDRPNVYLAGVQEAFVADSPEGVIGSKHMLEHLHPSVRGYFILANAYVDALILNDLLPEPSNNDLQGAWQEQPVTLADKRYGNFKVERLVSDYPFTTEKKNVILPPSDSLESSALKKRIDGVDWLTINQDLLTAYQENRNLPEAAKVAGLMADALPNNTQLTFIAGMLYKQINNLPLSTHHLLRAVNLNPENLQARLSLAQNFFQLGDKARSLVQLEQVKRQQPDHPQVDQFIQMVKGH